MSERVSHGVHARIAGMRERMVNGVRPELLPERALIVTESYRRHSGESVVVKRALALKDVLEQMTLFLDEDELFAGHYSPQPRSPILCPELGARWVLNDLESFANRPADAIYVSDENKAIIRDCLSTWQESSLDAVVGKLLTDEARDALAEGMITIGGQGTAQGNIAINNAKLLRKGLRGIIDEIDNKLAAGESEFLRTAKIACEAAIAFAHRYADLAEERSASSGEARSAELLEMARILRRVPENPAQSFREAVQSVWLVYTILHIESDPHAILLGRFDQYMYPFYKHDSENGILDEETALFLLASLWLKCTSIIKLMDSVTTRTFAGFPLFQNITIGGQGPRGEDACNPLSRLLLTAARLARVPQPSIGFRYHNRADAETLHEVCRTISEGLGYPAIMNDTSIVPKHLIRGATLEEARDYCTNCVETDIPGCTDSRPHSGYVNLPKCFLLAMNDGRDPVNGRRIGPATGSFESFQSFEELMQAFHTQTTHFIRIIADSYDRIDGAHAEYAPEPFMSSLLDDCIERGLTRQQGGVRYNFSGLFAVGLASTADSAAAVRRLCFEEASVPRSELLQALGDDFRGWPELRTSCTKAPKFGNDDDSVDDLACRISHIFCSETVKLPCIRGGFYIPELHSVSTHVYFGEMTGATPDGRLAGIALSDGASPVGGADRSGPMAALRSLAKIDHIEALQGVLFNQKLSPGLLKGERDIAALADYIRTWCDLGGHHIQFNVVSTESLRQAQANPEQFRDLIVRVAGYSAYFGELNRNTQDEIIARTEHEVLL